MSKKSLVVNGKTYSLNLKILKEEGSMDDNWYIKPVYYLELKHGLWGFFPAIITESKRIVITLDKNILKKIWEKLSPRDSRMEEVLFYINKTEPVGYPAQHYMGDTQAEANQLLTKEEFEELTKKEENPFKWASGLIGGDMSSKNFMDTIKSAFEKNHA